MAYSGLDIDVSPNSRNGAPSRNVLHKGDTVAGRFALVREIARGGMGVVYEARHCFTGRRVALKFVPPDVREIDLARKRLLQEAESLGALRHPAIVEVFDAGISNEVGPYIAMEMLEGRTLDGILAARRTLSIAETLHVAKAVAEALSCAHRHGVVHRDIKPSNIFVLKSHAGVEAVRLIDFGIAGAIAPTGEVNRDRLTRAGDMLGTLDYLSPEQLAQPETVEPRSDQYALGAVLLECLIGGLPTISDRLASRMPDLKALVPGIEDHVVAAIMRAMSPKPEQRFAEVADFAQALFAARQPGAVAILERGAPVDPQVAAGTTRRRHQRAPYIAPCRVLRADGTNIDGRSEDISEGGLLIVLPQSLRGQGAAQAREGVESIRVRFALPTTGVIATVTGLVRWIKDGKGRAALGIEFDGASPEVVASIATYVKLVGANVAES